MTNRLPVFYDARMSVPTNSYSPSSSKPEAVVANWQGGRSEVAEWLWSLPIELLPFEPATPDDLCLVHEPDYVHAVLAGHAPNGFGNDDRRVAQACLWTCGSMVAAAEHALQHGVACSPSSGFHHAGYHFGGGFCTFNGLMLAALLLRHRGLKVGILDCDFHYGNGTDSIIARLDALTMHHVHHWTAGATFGRGARPSEFFRWLDRALEQATTQCDIVLYQAGADAHIDDPLGGFLDDDQLAERDRIVFDTCASNGIACAWNLAGGYRLDTMGTIAPVLRTHRRTAQECIAVMGSSAWNVTPPERRSAGRPAT